MKNSYNYDAEAEVLYLRLANAKIAKTQEWGEDLLVDVDRSGKIVGVEILGVKPKPGGKLTATFDLPDKRRRKIKKQLEIKKQLASA